MPFDEPVGEPDENADSGELGTLEESLDVLADELDDCGDDLDEDFFDTFDRFIDDPDGRFGGLEDGFDDLAKRLAQAVSRRQALRIFGGAAVGLAALTVLSGPARAARNSCRKFCNRKLPLRGVRGKKKRLRRRADRHECLVSCKRCGNRGLSVCVVEASGGTALSGCLDGGEGCCREFRLTGKKTCCKRPRVSVGADLNVCCPSKRTCPRVRPRKGKLFKVFGPETAPQFRRKSTCCPKGQVCVEPKPDPALGLFDEIHVPHTCCKEGWNVCPWGGCCPPDKVCVLLPRDGGFEFRCVDECPPDRINCHGRCCPKDGGCGQSTVNGLKTGVCNVVEAACLPGQSYLDLSATGFVAYRLEQGQMSPNTFRCCPERPGHTKHCVGHWYGSCITEDTLCCPDGSNCPVGHVCTVFDSGVDGPNRHADGSPRYGCAPTVAA